MRRATLLRAALVEADTRVPCAGQELSRELQVPLPAAGARCISSCGADQAAELDAERAIDQGTTPRRRALIRAACPLNRPFRSH